ncbi:MAG: VapC toxin family PIN domain ribonuclease [Candidatus Makaraimicrobium thalassicum]|nr:MAG: VapC toxin family PIN domain ribonuclease [Candidatus Omnitrophota bacterium]
MKYLLDTCVVSELIKPKPNKKVLNWIAAQNENKLYISVLTFAEIEKGIEKASDQIRKKRLKLWVEDDLKQRFEGKIFPIDLHIATKWGEMHALSELAGCPMPIIDGLIAISGLINGCVVVTRNTSDMKFSSVALLNPWIEA